MSSIAPSECILTSVDWTKTPLGSKEQWPEILRALVEVHASSEIASCLFWGNEGIVLPNRAWERELGPLPVQLAGRSAADISLDLDRAYRAALENGSRDQLGKALMPLMWRSFVDRANMEFICTRVTGSDGKVSGILVQLGLLPDKPPPTKRTHNGTVRSNFILFLSDALRRLSNPDDVQKTGTRLLGEHMNADRASFSEVNLAAGRASERHEYQRDPSSASHVVEHELADFGPAIQMLRMGQPLIIDDMLGQTGKQDDAVISEVARYAHAPFRAQLTVPVLRAGELVSVITIRHDQPHPWSVCEIATAQDAGIRIWEAIERARAEQALRVSERRFRALVSASSQITYRMSPDWKELWHLDGRDYHHDVTEPFGEWDTRYLHPDDREEVMSAVRAAIEARDIFEMEHRVGRPDGSVSWVWSRAVPIFNEAGEIQEWFGATTDVTERREAEDRMRREAAAQLEVTKAADMRKSRLMAILAHDLRTPLVAVLGALDVLRSEEQDEMAREHVLERIERDGHGMLQLIDDVLELARLGSGELVLRPERFSAASLIYDTAELIRPLAARNQTEVVVDIEEMPHLFGDVMALRRVLMNFATNAVKATESGTITLSVKARAQGAEFFTVNFAVSDTGCGLAPENIPLIFRDFGTLDREDGVAGSTGLGLAICRRLAAAMGGEIGVESTPGLGSCFSLSVKLPEAPAEPRFSPAAPDPKAKLAGLRVLVAEDHETIRWITCSKLATCGAQAVEARDGIEAVERATKEKFDLILMDLRMPRLDGAAAAARIRLEGGPSSGAWIIAVTSHQNATTAALMSDLTLDACLPKPLDFNLLSAILRGETVAPERPDNDALFNPATLSELRAIDGGKLLDRALQSLIREISEAETELPVLLANGDINTAARLAHKLAGGCDVLGACALGNALRAFEIFIETVPQNAIFGALEDIIPCLKATRAAATSEIKRSSDKR